MSRLMTLVAVGVFALGTTALAQTEGQAGAQADTSAGVKAGNTSAQASARAGATARQQEGSASLAPGTAIHAALNQPVDSKKAKSGDVVTARTTEAVKADGKTVIPKGARLVGHVTRVSARAKGDAESALAVQFDRAEWKGHEEPVHVAVQALAAARETTTVAGDDLEPAGGAGGGAGVGTGRGRGLGGGVGAVGGAASGVTSSVPRVAGNATGAANSTANAAAGTAGRGTVGGLNAAGQLTSSSHGVFGLNGLSLEADSLSSTQASVITSTGKSVHLDGGTQILLTAQTGTATSAQK